MTEDEWFDMAWKEIWPSQSDGSLVLSSINETYDGIEYDHLEPYDDTITVVGAYTAAAFDCVSSLIPARVTTAMGQTRALDGRQTADWDGMAAEWSYHPNNGMSAVLYETD